MTSDKASVAGRNLDFALGNSRVSLGSLNPGEFDRKFLCPMSGGKSF